MIATATADRQSQFSKRATARAQATQSALPATGAIDPVAPAISRKRKLRPPGSADRVACPRARQGRSRQRRLRCLSGLQPQVGSVNKSKNPIEKFDKLAMLFPRT
jgi:hypothetical protein